MDELKWYLYDLIYEVMEKHQVAENAYSLDTAKEGAVCLMPSEHGFLVCGGGKEDLEQEDFYRGCREVFLRIFSESEAETAMEEFLTRTLDLPKMMEGPSISGLEARIRGLRAEVGELERKLEGLDGTKEDTKEDAKWKARLNLDRIYLKSLLENLKNADEKRYEKMMSAAE